MTRKSRSTIDAYVGAAALPWEALYAAHAGDIARYLRRLVGDVDTAADLTQETFARAMRAGRTPTIDEMRPWLFRIASNLAMSHLRRPRLSRMFGLKRETTNDSFEEGEQVRQAMRSIPPDQAATLALAFHEGFSRREIAEMLGVSEETVKSRVARGRLNFVAAYRRLERGLRA